MAVGFQISFILSIKTFIEKLLCFFVDKFKKFFKQDTYVLYDNIYYDNCECVESYAFFKYLQQNNVKSLYIINKNNCSFNKIKKETGLKDVVTVNSMNGFIFKLYFLLFRAHTVIASFTLPKVSKFLAKFEHVNRIFLEHGITVFKAVVKNSFTPKEYDYFVITSSKEKDTLLQLSDWKDERLIKTGLPRLDALTKNKNDKRSIFVMFTLRKAVHEGINNYYSRKIIEFITSKELYAILKSTDIKLKFASHYFISQNILNYLDSCNYDKNYFEFVPPEKISENILNSELCISDFSSIAFSFMYINTPVIFYRLDSDINKEHYLQNEFIDYAKTKDKYFYNIFYSLNETIEKIRYYAENNFILEDNYKKINENFFDYAKRGQVAKELYNTLEKLKKPIETKV